MSGEGPKPEAVPRPDRVGQVLLEKLRVIKHLGGGGMGDVYEVEHVLTHHRRALKILRPELARQPRYVERLLREASIAGRLQTPFVVETLDAGRLDDGAPYVLMELLTGRSLHEVLEIDPRLAQTRVANILAQVAEGMAVAHAAGIVHRDLKPENVFLVGDERDDRVKILDFGISKIAGGTTEPATRLTHEGSLIGTPFYMSPEQAAGRDVDARADVWAMGVIAYEALTGKVPFNGKTVGEVMMMIGAGMYPPVTTRRPDVDPEFAAVIDRALRPDPRDRYESAEAMRRDLLRFASNEPAARARTISDGPHSDVLGDRPLPRPPTMPREALRGSSPSNPSTPVPITGSGERAPRADPATLVVLALVIVFAVGATIFVSTSRSSPTVQAVVPSSTTSPPATELVTAPPETIVEIDDDAGAEPLALPPPTTTTSRPPRETPPHTPRTRAEQIGLEANPYGPR